MENEKHLEKLDGVLIDLLGTISHYFRARGKNRGEYYFIALVEMDEEINKAQDLIEKIKGLGGKEK